MLHAKLFGVFQLSLHDQLLPQITRRGIALFAYLITRTEMCPRSVLTDLLWDEKTETQARENLRGLLYTLRQVLGDYLVITRQAVGFNRQAPHWADIEVFGSYLAVDQLTIDPSLHKTVLQLYHSEFLDGFYVQNAPIFETWLATQRQYWHTQAIQGWQQLVNYHLAQAQYQEGIAATRHLLALEPWHEDAHRQQMLMLAQSGQQSAALAQYERCCQILRDEVDASPNSATITLYEQIKAGQWSPRPIDPIQVITNGHTAIAVHINGEQTRKNGTHGISSTPIPRTESPAPILAVDWGSMPHEPHFYGRHTELSTLYQWTVTEGCRVATVLGVGGQGKTALVVRFLHMLTERAVALPSTQVADPLAATHTFDPSIFERPISEPLRYGPLRYERIICRSLLTAPPLADILQDWLQQLSDQQVVILPHTLEQQFTLLHEYLQRRRFLFVLDNVESILQPDGSGVCHAGYEAYEQLWQFFMQRDHQCCLLLTSRERPRHLSNHEEQTGALRTLLLDGLPLTDGQQLLNAHRIIGQKTEIAALLRCYSGNPLALKLVADAIDEIFAGDVDAFLQEETPFFADIGAVLDQQFARLSPLELELITWLALEQEPVSSQTLWGNLVALPSKRDYLAALRTLVRRSLIQTQGELFGLQNVILEYTRNRLVNAIGEELTTARMVPTLNDGRWQNDKLKAGDQPLVTLSSGQPVFLSAFNRYALLKAQAKEYVRAGQQRLVLEPIARRLRDYWGQSGVATLCQHLLAELRATRQTYLPLVDGYAASNILHLLLMSADLRGYDFSQLTLRQAYLRDATLQGINFADANLQACLFTDIFAAVTVLAFHPRNGLLIAGGFNGASCAWEVNTGVLSALLPDHGQTIFCITFSHDGATLITAGIDQRICVWDYVTHVLRYTLYETSNFARSALFSPNDAWLIVGGGDGTVKFYDAATGKLSHMLTTPSHWLWSVALNSDGTLLAAGSVEGPIYLWALDRQMRPVGEMRILPGHHASTCQLLFSPDDRYLYSAGNDQLIHIWQVTDGTSAPGSCNKPWRTLRGHTDAVRTLALSPNGHYLASGGSDKMVRLWDARTGELLETLVGHKQWVWALAFQPRPTGEESILVSSGSDQRVFVWELAAHTGAGRGRLRQTLHGYANSLRTVQFHPDGAALISGGFDKLVRIWDLQTGQLQQTLQGAKEWLMPVTIDATGKLIAASGYDRAILLWRAETSQSSINQLPVYQVQSQITPTGHITVVLGLAFSPDGKILATSSQDQTIRLWNIKDASIEVPLLQILTGHTSLVWSVAFSPDGRWLASGSFDQTIRLWDVSNLQANPNAAIEALHTFTDHAGPVWCIAFTPDGQYLVSGSSDHTVRIWNIAQQNCRVLTGHTNLVRAVAVSPRPVAGRLTLASCDDGHCIRIWDVANGETIHCLYGHESFIHSLAYSPDGQTLASASEQGDIRLWDLQTGAHLQTLRAPRPYTDMEITGVTGITEAQKSALLALGAVEKV